MSETYYHSDETLVSVPAQRCYELVLAVRRYSQWWTRMRSEPLGAEGTLRIGSRCRFTTGSMSWVIEVTGLNPWRRIAWEYISGDLLGPVSWEFTPRGTSTLVRFVHHGVQPNSEPARRSFARGIGLQSLRDAMQQGAFAGMRRILESGHDVSGADLFEAIHTLRSTRRFRSDPVPDDILRHLIEAATHAPSARNAQPWYFVLVRDPALKRAVGALYQTAWEHAQRYTVQVDADADIKDRPGYERMMSAVDDLATRLDTVPVIVLACLDTRQLGPMADNRGTILAPQSAYASIFPAVQNLMLAARSLGLGSTLTTVYSSVEAEMRAVVGIPEHVHIAALVPVGYPARPFRVTKRKPVETVAFLDRWGAPLA